MSLLRRTPAHDPEGGAALYVQGEMGDRARRRFETHLLACEKCWSEVQQARAGRELAERGRELSPASLREDVRSAVALTEARARRRIRMLLPAAAVTVTLVASAILVTGVIRSGPPGQPGPIAAALESFRSEEPHPHVTTLYAAPDLETAGLALMDSGRTSIGGLTVDVFWFTDGRIKLVLFLSPGRFPEAVGATERNGTVHGWTATADGVRLACADSPVSYLLMSRDAALVQRAESALRGQPIRGAP